MGRRASVPMAVSLAALAVLLALPRAARAAGTGDPRCDALPRIDFSATPDAPFMVSAASVATDDAPRPYCRVTGYVAPEISFEMRLPLADWNHGFVLVGSGGWANEAYTQRCHEPLRKGYACIAGDSGHRAASGLWMQGQPGTKIDWGYRATHVKVLAARALARRFYGQPATSSLMVGCSTGGYQALVEAQRFPWDFSGIIAVAPDLDEGDLNMRTVWAARHFSDQNGKPLFTTADLRTLHAAALDACDMSDGVKDGIIGDPAACRFDPMTIVCKPGKDTGCLSQAQAVAASRIYAGPTTSRGERISTAGPFPGSEMGWPDFGEDVSFSNDLFRFALGDSPRDGVDAAHFDFDQDYKRLGQLGEFIDDNPDLRHLDQAGGKLMIIQGGNDVTEQAHASIDYYEMVERVMGGRQRTQSFARLFLVPGMNHCSGGDGAFSIDYLAAMERWVVDGQAPDVLVGAHVPPDDPNARMIRSDLIPPPPGTKVSFTRPVYPFPSHAVYDGHGDPNDAGSFHPASGE